MCGFLGLLSDRALDNRRQLIMNRAAASAPGFMTGARYLNSLRDNREVWLDGDRITDITQDKSFTGVVNDSVSHAILHWMRAWE